MMVYERPNTNATAPVVRVGLTVRWAARWYQNTARQQAGKTTGVGPIVGASCYVVNLNARRRVG